MITKKIPGVVHAIGMIFLIVNSCFAAALTEDLSQHLAPVKNFSAHFTQTVVDNRGHVLQQSAGQVQVMRPAQFYWQITAPHTQTICQDQKNIITYDAELQQAIIQARRSSQGANALPVLLLSGDAQQVLENFSIQGHNDQYVLQPKHVDEETLLLRITVTLNSAGVVQALEYATTLGQVVRLAFTHTMINQALHLPACVARLPAGTDKIYD